VDTPLDGDDHHECYQCCLSVIRLAQLVKAVAARTHVRSRMQEVRVRSLELNNDFHPSGVGKIRAFSI